MNVRSTFATSLIFVIIVYLFSIILTFLVPNYADASFTEATPSMFFGWIWFSIFSLVKFITTWGPIVIICVLGGLADILLKLVSNIWNAIPVLSDLLHFYYPGVTFQNSIDAILTINEVAYETILSLGTQLEWTGSAYVGYWTEQGAEGLLGGIGYFASGWIDIGQEIYDGFVTAGQQAADDLVAGGQEAAQAIIDAGQASADAIIGFATEKLDTVQGIIDNRLVPIINLIKLIQGNVDLWSGHFDLILAGIRLVQLGIDIGLFVAAVALEATVGTVVDVVDDVARDIF